MRTIYSPTGKLTTATHEDAESMIEHCGYFAEWPPKEGEIIPASVGHRPDDAEPGTQVDGQGLAPVADRKVKK